jgi:DNA-binding NtrC family response regulator
MEKENHVEVSDDEESSLASGQDGEEPSQPPGAMEYPIIGKSKAVDHLLKQIHRLAQNRRDIVVVGEAGVGKGAIAKNIYSLGQGPNAAKPFLSINLSVLDDKELEGVLFGYGRAAEGVPSTKRGLFELANGGTVLIEEIEEASFRNQMRIAGFLNERSSRRMGDEASLPVDIRLILTVKEDLKSLVEKRKLLEELQMKISSFDTVVVPPLRERPEDIPPLVQHFASGLCREIGIGELAIDINAIDVLVRQTWRENIRELKAVIDKSVLFSTGGQFTLPAELLDEKTEVVKMLNNIATGRDFILDKSLDVIEKGIIQRALAKFGFNQAKAAGFLGMNEQTLRYKLKRLNITGSRSRV